MVLEFFLIVSIGSLIGWITNYIAIKLLFKPYKEINLIGFKLQGLIPKRRVEIAKNVAETIDNELISLNDIINVINSIEFDKEIDIIAENIVKNNLKKEILSKFPMATMFINNNMENKIKEFIVNAIEANKDKFFKIVVDKLESEINIQDLIIERVEKFSLQKQEEIVYQIAKKELKHIELIGAILGALIGMVQFLITRIL
ncbi:MAG: DUF445 family protein [Fusobacteria bacterium]|nr:DUF445 family protein [Fusobacteriota bacterium]